MKDVQFPNIEQLELRGGGIYADMFPNIIYLNLYSNFNLKYEEICKLSLLKVLCVSNIDNVDILNQFNYSQIKRLTILGWEIEDLSKIQGFDKVEIIELLGLKKLKSLYGLEKLSSLQRVDVFNCNQLLNLGALYKSKTIEYFKLIECGKKWIDTLEQNKLGFEQKKFKVYCDNWRAFDAYLNEAETKWMYL